MKNNILATLAYYDIFDFPLKKEEILGRLFSFRHLSVEKYNENQHEAGICEALENLVGDGIICTRSNLYFLAGRDYLVPLRLKRARLAYRKMKRALRATWWLRAVPYLRAIFVSGSLAMGSTDELSDLDILVVAKTGRIWLTRFLITVCLSILGVRRKGSDKIAPDKVCPNHYITDGSMQIPFKSIYNAQTYSSLIPIYTSEQSLIGEFKEKNKWVLDYVRGWNIREPEDKMRRGTFGFLAALGESVLDNRLGDALERFVRRYQFARIAKNPLTSQAGGRVVFNDTQLEFHPKSIETDIMAQYNSKLGHLGLKHLAIEKDSGLMS